MWKAEVLTCERCGNTQVSVHPDCERCECSNCGHLIQSPPMKERDMSGIAHHGDQRDDDNIEVPIDGEVLASMQDSVDELASSVVGMVATQDKATKTANEAIFEAKAALAILKIVDLVVRQAAPVITPQPDNRGRVLTRLSALDGDLTGVLNLLRGE